MRMNTKHQILPS